MFVSRLLLNGGYLKNGVACSVGRRVMALETHTNCSFTDPNQSNSNESGSVPTKKFYTGLVYRDNNGKFELTKEVKKIDKDGKLTRYLDLLDANFTVGNAFTATDVGEYVAVTIGCIGPKDAKVNELEGIDEFKENRRCGSAGAIKAAHFLFSKCAFVPEPLESEDARPSAEGNMLIRWKPTIDYSPIVGYNIGATKGNAQNWARYLSHMPSTKMTPEAIVQEAEKELTKVKVTVNSYGKKDIEAKKMSAFLAAAQGSCMEPRLLECEYKGKPGGANVLMVAQGVTFDSGGLCLKTPENLLKRSSISGATVALGTMLGLAALNAAVNVKLVVPLCENMISGICLKAGDVVPTLQGLNVKVEDTRLVSHLMLADALTYGQSTYKPTHVVDVASLSPGIEGATGGSCYGCFTKSDNLWEIARQAGISSGDRPWRFPLWGCYSKQITGDNELFHLKNRGTGLASHCMAAAFLKKFVTTDNWLHYDITGVERVTPDSAQIYLNPDYITGRPTRALIEAIMSLDKKVDTSGQRTGRMDV